MDAPGAKLEIFCPRAPGLFYCDRMTGSPPLVYQPLKWIPSLYVAEGIPYALVASVAVLVYANLGLGIGDTAEYASCLTLPWVLKPLWGPLVEMIGTRRGWIWVMEICEAIALGGVAFSVSSPHFLPLTLVFFLLLGFCSATHDVAADGFYLLALSEHYQAFFSGVRNSFYRVAMIGAQGGLVYLVAKWFRLNASYGAAWRMGFFLSALLLFSFGVYHYFILPRPLGDVKGILVPQADENCSQRYSALTKAKESAFGDFFDTFISFFKKPNIVPMLTFLLLYRLGEAQLVKIAPLFLIAGRAQGGLGLAQEQLSLIYGTIGVIALLGGGLAGGFLASRHGLKAWLWPMLLAIHLPDAVFIWLAHAQPQNLLLIGGGVVVEQFGYGFGFSAFMLYMIYIARGSHQTSHYAICTGFMALGMMLPGMISGQLEEFFGYEHFFLWVVLATIPSFLAAAMIPLDQEFGKR